jgi:hypothetical protein
MSLKCCLLLEDIFHESKSSNCFAFCHIIYGRERGHVLTHTSCTHHACAHTQMNCYRYQKIITLLLLCGVAVLGSYLTGDVTASFSLGEAVFDTFQALCAPGHKLDLAFISGNRDISPIPLFMNFRQCRTGEYYADRVCSPCRNGTYSITDPSGLSLAEIREVNVCKDCPSGVKSCFADSLVLEKGYWRIGPEAVDVLQCPMNENSCAGGSATGDELCAAGYEVR